MKNNFPTAEQIIFEIVKKLKEQGVPDEINAYMAATALSRHRERKVYSREIINKLFEIEPMPVTSKTIFYYESNKQ